MNRATRSIIEIGIAYGVVVILIDFLLDRFSVLLWPTLSIISVIFAIIMLNVIFDLTSGQKPVYPKTTETSSQTVSDEVVRLQNTIERAIATHETQSVLVEKLRSVGLSLAAARMKLTREQFRALVDQNPKAANGIIKDQELLALLSGGMLNLTDLQRIDTVLTKIESA
jgi:hypothetical protein